MHIAVNRRTLQVHTCVELSQSIRYTAEKAGIQVHHSTEWNCWFRNMQSHLGDTGIWPHLRHTEIWAFGVYVHTQE